MPTKRKKASPFFVQAAGVKCLSPIREGVSADDIIDWKCLTSFMVRGFLNSKDSSRITKFFPDTPAFLAFSKKVFLLGSFHALENIVKFSAAYIAEDFNLLLPSKYGNHKYLLHRLGLAEETLKSKMISRAKCLATSFQKIVESKKEKSWKCLEISHYVLAILKTFLRHYAKMTSDHMGVVNPEFASKIADHEKSIQKVLATLKVQDDEGPLIESLLKRNSSGHIFFDGFCIKRSRSMEASTDLSGKCYK